MSQPQSIQEFFRGRSILITGATGFIGKVLTEKLLRSCPDLDTLYLLTRPKKGKSIEDRIQSITETPLFGPLKKEAPDALKKVRAVQGDVEELELGLSADDRRMLEEKVSIVFHIAASVRFDDPLPKAVFINVRGTREVVRLACAMKQLKVFLHVSTTFCNTLEVEIKEQMYPPPADWRTIIDIAENLDYLSLQILTKKLLGRQPNTYTFTKALAEHLINDYADKLPAVIVRPSIVISSIKEPIVGWVDNFNGPVGLLIGAGKGVVHTAYCDSNVRLDYIPVDIACKGLIAACWKKGQDGRCGATQIYQCSACDVKRITQGQMIRIASALGKEIPLNNILYYPCGTYSGNILMFYVQFTLFQLLPSLLLDAVLWMANSKIRLLKIQRRIFAANVALKYFVFNEWRFDNSKFLALDDMIPAEDGEKFKYVLKEPDEVSYLRDATWGCRVYLLKEDEASLPAARRHLQRMAALHHCLRFLAFLLLLWLAYKLLLPMLA